MNVTELVEQKLRALPETKQQQVLEFVESLAAQTQDTNRRGRRTLRGLWADLDADITIEDIEEARRALANALRRENA